MKSTIARWAFFIVGALNIIGHLLQQNDMARYSKALLMPLLIYYVVESSKGRVSKRILILVVALIFSWGGDLALIYPEYFLLGVGLFLVAQISYSYLFIQSSYQKLKFHTVKVIPYFIYGILLFYLLLPDAGDLRIPIFIYGLCLLTMAALARLREGFTSKGSYQYVLIGSILFLISDSLIAINKFYMEVPFERILIMGTYIVAQYLIAEGMLKHAE